MALKAGTLNDFADSMAEQMEIALEDGLQDPLPLEGDKARTYLRSLLIAIAQGVVEHIKNNLELTTHTHDHASSLTDDTHSHTVF